MEGNQVEQVLTKEEQLTNYEELTADGKAKVDEIFSTIDITDSQAVLQYGYRAQSDISSFSDSVLEKVTTKDSGYVGQVLSDLMINVKAMDVDDLNRKGFFGLFGGFKNSVRKFIARYEKLSVHIDRILNELEKSKLELLRDITVLDTLYDKNLEYMHELEYYITAGEMKIKEINEVVIPELKAKALETNDPVDTQKLNDYNQLLVRFEKKIHDLKLSRMMTIQTGPQIRLIQNSDQVLVEKVQSSILNTIPLWKNQVVIAISLFRQEKALKLQREVNQTTNEMLSKNSEMLKQNTIEVAKESEKGIIEIETLKEVNQNLIDTIEETMKIQQEGRIKRQQAEVELQAMENELRDKLVNS